MLQRMWISPVMVHLLGIGATSTTKPKAVLKESKLVRRSNRRSSAAARCQWGSSSSRWVTSSSVISVIGSPDPDRARPARSGLMPSVVAAPQAAAMNFGIEVTSQKGPRLRGRGERKLMNEREQSVRAVRLISTQGNYAPVSADRGVQIEDTTYRGRGH